VWQAIRQNWDGSAPLGLLLVAAPTTLAFLATPKWLPWFGITTPDSSLVPNLIAAVAYASAFGFGWLVHRLTDIRPSGGRCGR
jgi:hypothetical protein